MLSLFVPCRILYEVKLKFFKQVNFCPFTHAVSEGVNVYFQFKIINPLKNCTLTISYQQREIINPLKNCTLTISYQQREDTRNFSATHLRRESGENVKGYRWEAPFAGMVTNYLLRLNA